VFSSQLADFWADTIGKLATCSQAELLRAGIPLAKARTLIGIAARETAMKEITESFLQRISAESGTNYVRCCHCFPVLNHEESSHSCCTCTAHYHQVVFAPMLFRLGVDTIGKLATLSVADLMAAGIPFSRAISLFVFARPGGAQ
jgi:hypothetical protein